MTQHAKKKPRLSNPRPVVKFLVPNWGILYSRHWHKVVISARQPMYLAGQYDNPMPESTLSPGQGYRIWLQYLKFATFSAPLDSSCTILLTSFIIVL